MVTKSTTLIEKLVEVASAVRNIEKGGRNDAQNYSFVQEADVVRTVWPELLKRGILFYPAVRTVHSIQTYATKSGASAFLTTVESTWIATDGTTEIQVASLGQGTDTGGDKGVYKALTGDKKYAVLQLLGIATGDDAEKGSGESDESRESTGWNSGLPASAPAGGLNDEQKGLLMMEAKAAGIDPESADGMAALGQYIFDWTKKRSVKELDNDDLTKILTNLREIQTVAAAVVTA